MLSGRYSVAPRAISPHFRGGRVSFRRLYSRPPSNTDVDDNRLLIATLLRPLGTGFRAVAAVGSYCSHFVEITIVMESLVWWPAMSFASVALT